MNQRDILLKELNDFPKGVREIILGYADQKPHLVGLFTEIIAKKKSLKDVKDVGDLVKKEEELLMSFER